MCSHAQNHLRASERIITLNFWGKGAVEGQGQESDVKEEERSSCPPHAIMGRFPHSLLEEGMKRSAELSSGLHCSCTSQLTKGVTGVWRCGGKRHTEVLSMDGLVHRNKKRIQMNICSFTLIVAYMHSFTKYVLRT